MEPDPPKFRLQKVQSTAEQIHQQTGQQQVPTEFASVEAMLRTDAAQTTPPATIETRLSASIAREPAPKQSWWRRWFAKP